MQSQGVPTEVLEALRATVGKAGRMPLLSDPVARKRFKDVTLKTKQSVDLHEGTEHRGRHLAQAVGFVCTVPLVLQPRQP